MTKKEQRMLLLAKMQVKIRRELKERERVFPCCSESHSCMNCHCVEARNEYFKRSRASEND